MPTLYERTNPMIPMKRILLVDDEPAVLQSLRILLTSDGYEVETAWSSKEAWDMVNQDNFDLVVTDFNLPGMKGDELAARIKEHWPEIPVMMLTASAETLRASGRALPGVDVLMGMPFDLIEFRRELAGLLVKPTVPATTAREETWSDQPQRELVLAGAVEGR